MKAKKKEHFNDLLIPILCVVCIMPFVVRLAEYDYGFSQYLWHSDYSFTQDIYAYYRSYFFDLVCLFCVIILALRLTLYKERTKNSKCFIPLAVYSAFALLSTVFSIHLKASLTGNFYQFQSIFVLLGYCLISFYTYQILENENDYRTIVIGLLFTFAVSLIIGCFQICKQDLLSFSPIQRLIMNSAQFEEYGGQIETVFTGNNVFLSLFNPNYAAIFLVMLSCIFFALSYFQEQKRIKVAFGITTVLSLILTWYTYTRAALIALGIVLLLFLFMQAKNLKKAALTILPILLVLAIILVSLDGIWHFKYLSRILDTKVTNPIPSLTTDENGIHLATATINFDGTNITFTNVDSSFQTALDNSDIKYLFLEENDLLLELYGYSFEFIKEGGQYYYRTENGKLTSLEDIPHVNVFGYEYLGSGRLYIWSRVLPILSKYILIGSGPDTFAEAYPQNDYVGKIIYCDTDRRVLEGAHNDYLSRAVQTGVLSSIALIVFYVLLCKRCFLFYKKADMKVLSHRMGYGCFLACTGYLICSFFSDATLYTTPLFFVFAGIALAGCEYRK